METDNPNDYWLEKWRKVAEEQGKRALEDLRVGVGFLDHPHNTDLRDALSDGTLDKQDYYRQLLRLVYRMLFLFVAEDRDLLHIRDATEQQRAIYQYYSTDKLRNLAANLRGTRHHDLFESLRLVMRLLGGERQGANGLGLPVLGSFLFSDEAMPYLLASKIANRDLLEAVRAISTVEDREIRRLRRVDFKNLGSEELGSVYESLLELHPDINLTARTFVLKTAGGNERKTTGSYYTPTSLINALLDSALDPVLDEAIGAGGTRAEIEERLLELKVVDPACGSGHFLIAAANRMAKRLASVRTGEDEPTPEFVTEAKRDVIANCIYGVDLNEMAVELCKVNLWLESIDPGKPLTFLDAHIRQGNSLLGTTPALMARGIPEDAFPTKSGLIEGDQNKIVSNLRKQNRDELKQREAGVKQRSMFDIIEPPTDYTKLSRQFQQLAHAPDDTLSAVRTKERLYRALAQDPEYVKGKFLADLWCAVFVWMKAENATYIPFGANDNRAGRTVPAPPTDLLYRNIEDNPLDDKWADIRAYTAYLADRYDFFHWHIAFPEVFSVRENPAQHETPDDETPTITEVTGWDGGFDVVLGNPPWETSDLMKVEFFATLIPAVVSARTTEDREEIIDTGISADVHLRNKWHEAIRQNEGERHMVRSSGFLSLTSVGKLNTYRSFAEISTLITRQSGLAGLILKSGIVNAQDNNLFFSNLVENSQIVSIVDFINKQKLFPAVVANERFCFFVVTGGAEYQHEATFSFGLEAVTEIDYSKALRMKSRELALLNPNDVSVPPITSTKDKRLLVHIHDRIGVLVNEKLGENSHQVIYSRGHLNSSTHSRLFSKNRYEILRDQNLIDDKDEWDETKIRSLIEGKLMALYNHRFGTFQGVSSKTRFGKKAQARTPTIEELQNPNFRSMPRFWLKNNDAQDLINSKSVEDHGWMLTYRHICRAIVDARTAQMTVVPTNPASDSCALLLIDNTSEEAANSACIILSTFSSFIGDYVVRQKIYGPALTKAITLQLPVIPPHTYSQELLDFIVPRVLELTYTAWDLQAFAQDVGYQGTPFIWDDERRFWLRAELDALYFHLYGIERDDVDYIMETFPIVKRKDIAATSDENGEGGMYRTKDAILAIYDDMANLPTMDVPAPKGDSTISVPDVSQYQPALSPPPASPEVAHES